MSTCCLGNHFDINGGGMDLQFPHHENEIAQSEGATREPFVNLWMHNGFVRVNDEKMSKSLGNFFTIREVLKVYKPEVVRYFFLTSHYRSPLNYSDQQLTMAQQALDGLYIALRDLPEIDKVVESPYRQRFYQTLDDDFNTAEALAVLSDMRHEINRKRSLNLQEAAQLGAELKQLGGILGLLQTAPETYFKAVETVQSGNWSDAEVEAHILARNQARASRNWAEADRIRDELKNQGIILEDDAQGTRWRRS
jgi:cysteinyl-tRNA synthetase